MVEQGLVAERCGFSSFWLAELHFTRDFSVMPAPQLLAAAIAARTQRLRLGIGVYILPVHHPLRLAEEAAALDVLSGGRLDFGAGRGHPFTRVYEGFGVPAEESRQRFDESLEIVRRAWTEPRLTFKGRFHSFEDIELVPKPVQKPHPPIHIGAISPGSFSSAAEHGYSIMCPAQVTPVAVLKEMLASYREQALHAGHSPSQLRVSLLLPVFAGANQKDAESMLLRGLKSYYETTGRLMHELIRRNPLPEQFKVYEKAISFVDSLNYQQVLQNNTAFGEPAAVRERLLQLREELQLDEVLAWVNIGGLEHEKVCASMRLISEQVLPFLN
jgi:alkanesulfonate monooxygenase SsuD/methylene tetrahydromethanopterin reductase-like flavin-dependent oxidoreductase (luciferase family)